MKRPSTAANLFGNLNPAATERTRYNKKLNCYMLNRAARLSMKHNNLL